MNWWKKCSPQDPSFETVEVALKFNSAEYGQSDAIIVPRIKWFDGDRLNDRVFTFTKQISLTGCQFTEPRISVMAAYGFRISWEAFDALTELFRNVPGVLKVTVDQDELEVTIAEDCDWTEVHERVIATIKERIYPGEEVEVVDGNEPR